MNRKINRWLALATVAMLAFWGFMSVGGAEVKTYRTVGEYAMRPQETQAVAKERAGAGRG